MARSVFVSYSDPDRECALELVSRLEANSISVWVAPRDVAPSADWACEIIDAISAARLMVLVFSLHSNASPQVRREVERAIHKQVPVLPFRIENVLPSKSLEYFLSSQHWLDAFPPPREPHYAKLCAHVTSLLGAAAAGEGDRQSYAIAGSKPPRFSVTVTELQFLERTLAYHVGPVAKLLIKRALAEAADWEQLTLRLASELDSEAARRRFVDACRSTTTLRLIT
jgi:hypothetical protein